MSVEGVVFEVILEVALAADGPEIAGLSVECAFGFLAWFPFVLTLHVERLLPDFFRWLIFKVISFARFDAHLNTYSSLDHILLLIFILFLLIIIF